MTFKMGYEEKVGKVCDGGHFWQSKLGSFLRTTPEHSLAFALLPGTRSLHSVYYRVLTIGLLSKQKLSSLQVPRGGYI